MNKICLSSFVTSPVPRNVAIVAEVVAVLALAVGLITLFALNGTHLGPFNSFGHLGKIGEIAFLSSGSALAFVATCVLIVRALLQLHSANKANNPPPITVVPVPGTFRVITPLASLPNNPLATTQGATPSIPPVIPAPTPPQDPQPGPSTGGAQATTPAATTSIPVNPVPQQPPAPTPDPFLNIDPANAKKVDDVFKPADLGGMTPIDFEDKQAQDLMSLSKVIPKFPTTPATSTQQQRSAQTKKELAENHRVTKSDGLGNSTVLFRGFTLPDPSHVQIDKASTESMTTLIGRTFADGMYPNGYVHQANGSKSKYYDKLTFENGAHNWLVSTTFSFGTACSYATREVGFQTGIVFVIDASLQAMDSLFGVNLSARGLVGEQLQEISFLTIPPEYILGAMPVMWKGQDWNRGDCVKVFAESFVANPYAQRKIQSVEELKTTCVDDAWEKVLNAEEYRSCHHTFEVAAAHAKKAFEAAPAVS